jgi:hypothetical protein
MYRAPKNFPKSFRYRIVSHVWIFDDSQHPRAMPS